MPKGDREIFKADTEDGWAPIANLLLEALAIAPLGGVKKSAVIALWRITYGWTNGNGKRRTEAEVTLAQWGTLLNTHPVYAQDILRELVKDNIFKRHDLGKGKGYRYSLNTRVKEWLGGKVIPLLTSNPFALPPRKSFTHKARKSFTPSDTNLASPRKSINKNINKELPYRDRRIKKVNEKPDPDKYFKGEYGNMVIRSHAELEARDPVRAEKIKNSKGIGE